MIIKEPHITEKSSDLAKIDQYVFKVSENANKSQIKKEIESLYKVKVLSVRIIKKKGKKRRLGRISGWAKAYKKAIVKIQKGQKIEILPK